MQKEKSKKFNSFSEWKKKFPKGYKSAINLGVVKKLCQDFGWDYKTQKDCFWTKEKIISKASEFKNLKEWRKLNNSLYKNAKKKGLIKEICDILNWNYVVHISNHFWTKEKCIEEARKYKTRGKWSRSSYSSWEYAKKNNFLEECISHMEFNRYPVNFFKVKENCIKEARKYDSIRKWYEGNYASYENAKSNGWFNECISHMTPIRKPCGFWTKENCIKEAKKYKTKSNWRNRNESSYNAAKKNKWIDECCQHMIIKYKPINCWTLEECRNSALLCKTKSEWSKRYRRAYVVSLRNNWLDECCIHMVSKYKPFNYWTLEKCKEDALKYKKKTEWCRKSSGAYGAALKNNWHKECCLHMKK